MYVGSVNLVFSAVRKLRIYRKNLGGHLEVG